MGRGIIISSLLGTLLFLLACQQTNPDFQEQSANPEFVHRSMQKLTDVIVHDIFPPPVASRIYAYASIAGYEAGISGAATHQSLAGQLHDLSDVPKPVDSLIYCFPLAGIHAFLLTGKAMIFSEDKIEAFEQEIYEEFKALNMPKEVFDRSMAYGKLINAHVLAWADKDMYKQTRTYPKYTIPKDKSKWRPTPPDYMAGIEPHWNKIRTFVLDSAQQFTPPPPTAFDMTEGSLFYKEVMEVYHTLDEKRDEKIEIAEFWDCNPYVSHHKGHVMFATKKITPGGHWIGIVKIVGKKANSNFSETLEAYALTSIALSDGFISCWDEKYRSSLVRPETVINEHIDEDWLPALQTPPFPEYTSGHSVISRAAATALTSLYGDNFAFIDSTEVQYGLPVRSFKSFYHASDEAAISRLYGGIHYSPACFLGVEQGEKVGQFVVDKLKLKKK